MKYHTIPSDLLQAILNYLDTRPHSEVRRLIDEIMKNAKEIKEPAVEDPKEMPFASASNPYMVDPFKAAAP